MKVPDVLLPVSLSLAALVTTACEGYIADPRGSVRREAYYFVLSDKQLVLLHSEVTSNPVTGFYDQYNASLLVWDFR